MPLVLAGGVALAAQDRSTLVIPKGIAFSDFKGYESWETVAVSATPTSIKTIIANPVMIAAYKSGIPGNGKPFPDGSMIAKIEWLKKPNAVSPYPVDIPDTLKTVSFIEKDGKKFADTHGWGYAQWDNDPKTATLKPSQLSSSGHACGNQCHTTVAKADYIFTAYANR